MPRDRQVIIGFLTGKGDKAIGSHVAAMAEKWTVRKGPENQYVAFIHKSEVNRDYPELRKALKSLGKDSRLYIHGHGNWAMFSVGGLGPTPVADFLVRHGLRDGIGLISVTACNSAIGGTKEAPAEYASLENSVSSFTGFLHFELGKTHKIRAVCHGRVGAVIVFGITKNTKTSHLVGKKTTRQPRYIRPDPEDRSSTHLWHRKESKVCFTWAGRRQLKKFVDYGTLGNIDLFDHAVEIEISEPKTRLTGLSGPVSK